MAEEISNLIVNVNNQIINDTPLANEHPFTIFQRYTTMRQNTAEDISKTMI